MNVNYLFLRTLHMAGDGPSSIAFQGSNLTELYSCCVDEVAAQHVQADSVIHYGHACLSP